MANFGEVADRIKSIDIGKMFKDFMVKNENSVIDLLQSQLYQGETSDGKIRTEKSGDGYYGRSLTRKLKRLGGKTYAEYKNQINPSPGFGNPDLFLSGDFYQGMFLQDVDEVSAKIWSRDRKAKLLATEGWITNWKPSHHHEPYGLTIFELNGKSLQMLKPKLQESLKIRIKEKLNEL